jgi:hypothetical protein
MGSNLSFISADCLRQPLNSIARNQSNIARLERSHAQATVRTLKRIAATGPSSTFSLRRLC